MKEGELPMSVADMDWRVAPEIVDALKARLDQGVFGYSVVPDEWYDAYSQWWGRRHGLRMERENMIYSKGVLPTISSSVRRLTVPAEGVVLQTPVYNCFWNCIRDNGRRVVENPLVFEDGRWRMDLEDLERKVSDPETTMMILCNPHNPVGRAWTSEELAAVGDLCEDNGVIVLSDEIHCDITDPGRAYVPFASVSETCRDNGITAVAPTKCFNIAGIESSAAYIPDRFVRHKLENQLNKDECGEPNYLSIAAAVSSFGKGEPWLEEMNRHVFENKRYVEDAVQDACPDVLVPHTEATYLLWIDCTGLKGSGDLSGTIRRETGLVLSDGTIYGAAPDTFLRMNVAYPTSVIEDGTDRLIRGIRAYSERSP